MTDLPHDAEHFVGRYAPRATPALAGRPRVPTLADSLAHFRRLPGMPAMLEGLGPGCRCLLQGCTAPTNAAALQRFLDRPQGRQVTVTAVDLLDLPTIYERLGWPIPPMRFVRTDARALGAHFAPGSFDLVVQDFLLNCAPPAEAPALLAAARQMLGPGGLLLLSITDSTGLHPLPAIPAATFAARHGVPWRPEARDLAALLPDPELRAALLAGLAERVVLGADGEEATLITAPHGRFEFFVPIARTLALLAAAGFELLLRDREQGSDDHGLECSRWRCLARAVG